MAWAILLGSILGALLSGCDAGPAPGADGGPRPDVGPDAGPEGFDGGTGEGYAWSLIVLPDTQYLSESYPEVFQAQTRWIAEHRDELHIQFVLHVGDIVQDNDPIEWDVARAALSNLDGVVPYVLTPGNHDYALNAMTRETLFNAYFPLSRVEAEPYFGGAFEEGRADNAYYLFDTPTGPWLVLAMEFGPRDALLPWADEVLRAHAGIPAIVVTHAFMYYDDTRYDWATYGRAQQWNPHSYGIEALEEGVNDAEEMFQGFIYGNDHVELVLSGHVLEDGLGRLTSPQAGGDEVHQILANYQVEDYGGGGFLRIMRFSEDGSEVAVTTYSPYYEVHRRDPDNEFTLAL